MTETLTVVIHHPNKILLDRFVQIIKAAGYTVFGTSTEDELLSFIRDVHPLAVLLIPLAAEDLTVAGVVKKSHPSQRIVVLAETETLFQKAQASVDEVVLYDENDIGNILEGLAHPAEAPDSRPAAVTEDAAVLIVDDETDARDVISEYLTRSGYRTFTASTGKEAVEAVRRNPEIRVVLLDIKLPDVGGVQVLRDIAGLRGAPSVIMVTAIADSVIAKHVMRIGACDYLVKPIEFVALESAITACLARQDYAGNHWWKRRQA